ncbi:hydrogenase large subunit [Rhodocyclaceae bacterium]|nr:hydrogenase large subunit [Rhodocyclaceae bacterium]
MASRIVRDIPFNRVEGDLEVGIEVTDGRITDAWSAGTLYRGFENMMKGRGALDGLVMTPRICGICSTTHLSAAAQALDAIAGLTPPDNAVRVRNVALMVEHMQSDVRQSVLMYMADFAQEAHGRHPLHDEALRRYAPAAGSSALDTIRETKRLIEAIGVLGGQWPHSSFMVPGGIAFAPSQAGVLQCRQIVDTFRGWYERRVLGCSLARWAAVDSGAALDAWLDESLAHRESEVGFLLRFGREAGLDAIGAGPGAFLSYGAFDLPRETAVAAPGGKLIAAGLARATTVEAFDPGRIAEDVSHAWYRDSGALHPAAGETTPYASGRAGRAYSWIKAPRYDGRVIETGPLAEAVVDRRPLFVDLVANGRTSALVRQLARLTRPAILLPAVDAWLQELLAAHGAPIVVGDGHIPDGEGCGLLEAARGALGHWVRIEEGRIAGYQIITPTAWNGSPRDAAGRRGAWEEAMIGTPVADPENPVEAGHVVRSFDPCLVCAVHTVRRRA